MAKISEDLRDNLLRASVGISDSLLQTQELDFDEYTDLHIVQLEFERIKKHLETRK